LLDDETKGQPSTSPFLEERTREEELLRCRRCGYGIARSRDRIEVEGRHTHVFVNPSAIEFKLGCFRQAAGCTLLGEQSTYFSWFRGYAWVVALCGQCDRHLGWGFVGRGGQFYGLIVDRLVA
jgi:hypothetical protein